MNKLVQAEIVGGPDDGRTMKCMSVELRPELRVYTDSYPGYSYHVYRKEIRTDGRIVYHYEGVR